LAPERVTWGGRQRERNAGGEDRVLDSPTSGAKGSKGMNQLDCIRGKSRKGPDLPEEILAVPGESATEGGKPMICAR
jgi:hypothetical protein